MKLKHCQFFLSIYFVGRGYNESKKKKIIEKSILEKIEAKITDKSSKKKHTPKKKKAQNKPVRIISLALVCFLK